MIVAGIDPSLKATAVVVGDGSKTPISKVFSSHKGDRTVASRFTRYENQVGSVCDWLNRYDPDVVYIEGYVFGKWDVTPITEYGAILRWNLLDFGPVHEIAPTVLKKFATGHGGSKRNPVGKPQVMQAIFESFGVTFATDDEYDAYAAWRLGCVGEGVFLPSRPHELECVQTVLNPPEKKRRQPNARGPKASTRTAK